ncbi:MAG: hypothetical protein M1834_001864 [Cirrosporium novae-zelandiae]|nr:MAG: hypothetical protein M1834_001864 [Cirrosporium novae-zelandiae]
MTLQGPYLFGGTGPWCAQDWTASDDRVRGGKSQSYLDCSTTAARFYGTLDITALGGAGFASQHTIGNNRSWDLSKYSGIKLAIDDADDKQYTFILKDTLLPPDSGTGMEQSTISYEYDFKVSGIKTSGVEIDIPWTRLKPTYRGREKKDAPSINLKDIKRVSIMARRYSPPSISSLQVAV